MQVEAPVIQRPGWIVLTARDCEIAYKPFAQRIGGQQFQITVKDEDAEVISKLIGVGGDEWRFFEPGFHVDKSGLTQAISGACSV